MTLYGPHYTEINPEALSFFYVAPMLSFQGKSQAAMVDCRSIALLNGVSGAVEGTAGSFAGYVTVWVVCGVTALVAAAILVFVPKEAFTDRTDAEAVATPIV